MCEQGRMRRIDVASQRLYRCRASLAAIPILVSSPEYFIREHCFSLYPDLESASCNEVAKFFPHRMSTKSAPFGAPDMEASYGDISTTHPDSYST